MVYEIFDENEKKAAYRERRKLLIIYFVVLALFLVALGLMIGFNLAEVIATGSRRLKAPFMATGIVLAVLFASFSLFFFSIKFRLTRKYVRMLRDIDTGLKDTTTGKFLEFDEALGEKDGVQFYGMLLECAPLKRGDITTRKVLIEKDIDKPDLNPGDKLRFTTHANILISYEILARAEVKAVEAEHNETQEETEEA